MAYDGSRSIAIVGPSAKRRRASPAGGVAGRSSENAAWLAATIAAARRQSESGRAGASRSHSVTAPPAAIHPSVPNERTRGKSRVGSGRCLSATALVRPSVGAKQHIAANDQAHTAAKPVELAVIQKQIAAPRWLAARKRSA